MRRQGPTATARADRVAMSPWDSQSRPSRRDSRRRRLPRADVPLGDAVVTGPLVLASLGAFRDSSAQAEPNAESTLGCNARGVASDMSRSPLRGTTDGPGAGEEDAALEQASQGRSRDVASIRRERR